MHTPAGYSRLQIALHWIMALLILWRFLLNDAMTRAWDAIGEGLQPAFSLRSVRRFWRMSWSARRSSLPLYGGCASRQDAEAQRWLVTMAC